jgi:hypothetical protein
MAFKVLVFLLESSVDQNWRAVVLAVATKLLHTPSQVSKL